VKIFGFALLQPAQCLRLFEHFFILYVSAVNFIDNTECEELLRLRIELLEKKEEDVKLCNLLGWCLRSENYIDDTEMIVQHFTLLLRLDRINEFLDRVRECTILDVFQVPFLFLCSAC